MNLTRRHFNAVSLASVASVQAGTEAALPKDDGYRGIWYFNQPSNDQYAYKYSGGFATYPQQHAPIAIYAPQVHKTFFCYGGTVQGKHELLHMVSWFDHKTGMVPRPTILLNKRTEDAHDNPTISLDDEGYVWIFSSAHGVTRPSFIHRSAKPYSVDRFERILETNFSYTQPWYLKGSGFLFLHTRYRPVGPKATSGRALFSSTSKDGRTWSEPRELAFAAMGHYQISWPDPAHGKLGTAFDIHPAPVGLNARTNLYYMETRDFGQTWLAANGRAVELPIRGEKNLALVRDYRSEGLLVYLKDLQYDSRGNPILVYLLSKGYESGPANSPRTLQVARWDGARWSYSTIGETDHNYDHGSLYVEDNFWRFVGPTGKGPQPWSTGGEVECWESRDAGRTWKLAGPWTRGSEVAHTYVRRPLNAHPDFYALWADGNPLKPSESRLYMANRKGEVFRLPDRMTLEHERPKRVFTKG
jgi:hypothetical protein